MSLHAAAASSVSGQGGSGSTKPPGFMDWVGDRLEAREARKLAERGGPEPIEIEADHVCELCGKTGHHRSYHVPGNKRPTVIVKAEPTTAVQSPTPPVASAAAPAEATSSDLVTQIERLNDLREQGVLSGEEFAAAKVRLLEGR
jgi:hypothetical protein